MLILQLIVINSLFLLSVLLLWPAWPLVFVFSCIVLALWLFNTFYRIHKRHTKLRDMLEGGFRSLHDNDFAISLPYTTDNNDKVMIDLFNSMTEKLRAEKQTLYQRELLLDKVVNTSDTVTVLINQRQQVIFANIAALHFFNRQDVIGSSWADLCHHQHGLSEHIQKNNAIIQLIDDKDSASQSWHFSQYRLKLHGANHQLILLKPMTKELQEQELKTWKKVIRVINHELNNSIAPISSMCHSGQILANKLAQPQLDRVFNTISSRIQKLSNFIQSYSQLARLASPKKQSFDLLHSLQSLEKLYQVQVDCHELTMPIHADVSQVEQLLINLLKNANEACPEQVCRLKLWSDDTMVYMQCRDFGAGMSVEVMQRAFLPYYSTKANGSGIGLSICKEVVDAHFGQITLNNHLEGGLVVTVSLPIT